MRSTVAQSIFVRGLGSSLLPRGSSLPLAHAVDYDQIAGGVQIGKCVSFGVLGIDNVNLDSA